MRSNQRYWCCIAAIIVMRLALAADEPQHLSVATPPSSEMGPQWLSYNNRLDGQRFSTLNQITVDNAHQLAEVCRVQIDGPTGFNAGLIVVNGVIYTSTPRETVAIDATTCAVRWKYSYVPDEEETASTSRGVAVMDGRVFRGTGDGRLIALDAITGKLLWKNVVGSTRLAECVAGAPLAWQGVVYAGIAGSEHGVRGRVMAYDAITGRELWRFNTIPMGNQIGAKTWKRPESAKTGGGGVWGSMSLDATTGELFVPVGNPWPDIDYHYRPGENLFTNTMLILDAHSGALKWWHQVTPADWKDMDLAGAPVLYRDSKIRDVMAFAGKDGYLIALDRDTHKELFRTPVTSIQNADAKLTAAGARVCPSFAGGVLWNGPTLDRINKNLVVGSVDLCFKISPGTTEYAPPAVNFGGNLEPDGEPTGWVTALDSESGQVRWRYHAEKPVTAAVTPTAGGVTFSGDLAGNFLVFDSKNGNVLLKYPTRGALAGGVVTYEIAQRQYVAFASGNVSRTAFGALGLPSVVVMALPDQATSAASSESPRMKGNPTSGIPNINHGRQLYTQVCAACHGSDGNMMTDHKLRNLSARRDRASTIEFVKSPKPPMPKVFPDLLKEQDIVDVVDYVRGGLVN
jgi:alcohol dehydrogenase (cytochrome c)